MVYRSYSDWSEGETPGSLRIELSDDGISVLSARKRYPSTTRLPQVRNFIIYSHPYFKKIFLYISLAGIVKEYVNYLCLLKMVRDIIKK